MQCRITLAEGCDYWEKICEVFKFVAFAVQEVARLCLSINTEPVTAEYSVCVA